MSHFEPETGNDPVNPQDDVLSRTAEGALQEVLQANGMMLTGLIGIATFMDLEGQRYLRLLVGSEMNEITSLGMVRKLDQLIDNQSRYE